VTVGGVSADLLRHPVRSLICRWHWKGAALSAVVRGSLFFATNLTDGLAAGARATVVECLFGVPFVGVFAAAIQAFSGAEPPWAATLVIALLFPVLAQAAEFAVHWAACTPRLGISMLASIALSVLSTAFNLYVMRRGVLIVGGGARRFSDDVKELPRLVVTFVLALPRALVHACAR
jgi:hypothetical protein